MPQNFNHFGMHLNKAEINKTNVSRNSPVYGEYGNISLVFVQQIFHELWALMYDAVKVNHRSF